MAKKSRRIRRQESEKQRNQMAVGPRVLSSPVAEPEVAPQSYITGPVTLPAKAVDPNPRKSVNFAQEYFYVYNELQHIVIIAILMFIVMAGLSFLI